LPFKGLPNKAYQQWEAVYKSAKAAGDSESKAAKKAWGVIKKRYKKVGKRWVKKTTSTKASRIFKLINIILSEVENYDKK
jgi:hypothetical protein